MLDAVATIILAGMMFLPIINLVVGTVAGRVAGGFAGAALAFLIHNCRLRTWIGQTGCVRAAGSGDGKTHFSPKSGTKKRPGFA
jgi:hypothetical protein